MPDTRSLMPAEVAPPDVTLVLRFPFVLDADTPPAGRARVTVSYPASAELAEALIENVTPCTGCACPIGRSSQLTGVQWGIVREGAEPPRMPDLWWSAPRRSTMAQQFPDDDHEWHSDAGHSPVIVIEAHTADECALRQESAALREGTAWDMGD